jgi:hypothetical protein
MLGRVSRVPVRRCVLYRNRRLRHGDLCGFYRRVCAGGGVAGEEALMLDRVGLYVGAFVMVVMGVVYKVLDNVVYSDFVIAGLVLMWIGASIKKEK